MFDQSFSLMLGAEPPPWLSPPFKVWAPMVAPCVIIWRRRIAAAHAGGPSAGREGAAISADPLRPASKSVRSFSAARRSGDAAPLAAVRATLAKPEPTAPAPLFPAAPAE
jgi:hypothetical protein